MSMRLIACLATARWLGTASKGNAEYEAGRPTPSHRGRVRRFSELPDAIDAIHCAIWTLSA